MRVVGNRLRHNFPISPFQTQRSDSALPDYHILQLFARTWRRRFLRDTQRPRLPLSSSLAVHPCAQLPHRQRICRRIHRLPIPYPLLPKAYSSIAALTDWILQELINPVLVVEGRKHPLPPGIQDKYDHRRLFHDLDRVPARLPGACCCPAAWLFLPLPLDSGLKRPSACFLCLSLNDHKFPHGCLFLLTVPLSRLPQFYRITLMGISLSENLRILLRLSIASIFCLPSYFRSG